MFDTLKIEEYLEKFSKRFGIIKVTSSLSPIYEIPKVIEYFDKSKEFLMFNNVRNYPNFKVIANILNRREKLYSLLNVSTDEELYAKILTSEEKCSNLEIEIVSNHDYKTLGEVNLYKLPIAKFYELEPNQCLTSGIVLGLDLSTGFVNASIHRLSIIGKDKLVVRLVPRHLYTIWRRNCELNKDTPVAIIWTINPIFHLVASCSPPFGYFEISMIKYLVGLKPRFYILDNNVPAPIDAEIIIEGYLSKDLKHCEGPYVDILKLYDEVREQPIIKVTKIYVRNPELVYAHVLVPGLNEHRLLMSIEKEAKIWKFVKNVVPEVKKVRLTSASGCWLHAVISVKKLTEGDAKNAILAAFSAHPSLKHVIVVDDDIDPDNLEEVEWAIATRFRGDEDLVIIKYVRGSTLDPSAIDQEIGLTTKIGIDATKPLYKDIKKFEKAKIPSNIKVENLRIEYVK